MIAFGVYPLFLPLAITAFGGPGDYFSLAIIAFGAFGFIVPKYYYRLGNMEFKESRLLNLRRLRSSRFAEVLGSGVVGTLLIKASASGEKTLRFCVPERCRDAVLSPQVTIQGTLQVTKQVIRSEKLQNESFSQIFRIFVPDFASNFAPNFALNSLRSFRASFRGKRRPEKIHQKSPPFCNAKFPGKFEE